MEPLVVSNRLVIPADELEFDTARAGGPGGQKVNKTETRVQLRFAVKESRVLSEGQRRLILERLGSRMTRGGELLVDCSVHRSQQANLQAARERLAGLLSDALAPRKRRATKPTRSSVRRRLEGKRRRSDLKRERGKRHE